jgi:SAM-dependent methyltransferase
VFEQHLKFVNPINVLRSVARRIRSWPLGVRKSPSTGRIDFGDFKRLTPISQVFGTDRGQPIDRYYIEGFLDRHAADIRGRVVEVFDNSYTRRFGGKRVVRSDVLDINPRNRLATFVADLTNAAAVPSNVFDCFILTQTLQLIYDLHAAVRTVHRLLAPGGVLLATIPGISQIDRYNCAETWCWGFTKVSARRLFEQSFRAEDIEVTAHGNVLSAVSFLQGVATQELRPNELDYVDPFYEMLITVRAVKSGAES